MFSKLSMIMTYRLVNDPIQQSNHKNHTSGLLCGCANDRMMVDNGCTRSG